MPIPDCQSIMLPLLKLAGDRDEHSLRDAIETLAGQHHLSEAERRERLPSGCQNTFNNRVGWARTYMAKAGLLQAPRPSAPPRFRPSRPLGGYPGPRTNSSRPAHASS